MVAASRRRDRVKMGWIDFTPRWACRSRCRRYAVQIVARRGKPDGYLAWFYPEGVPASVLDEGNTSRAVGLFSVRDTLVHAKGDAQHHANTGVCRP